MPPNSSRSRLHGRHHARHGESETTETKNWKDRELDMASSNKGLPSNAAKPLKTTTSKATFATAEAETTKTKKRGWDEIEGLFQEKKRARREEFLLANQSAPKASRTTGSSFTKNTKGSDNVPPKDRKTVGGEWADDGLGGMYNSEGYTGRVQEGVRVFKAHVLNRPRAGFTDQCPFDCNCCFI